ncbi:LacI family DNA-binding transcriptional regulator [uncultured Actinomyces sp.]|uniref:LacI family DNA-binding transcriptional regulator n=1 Tax=uncultured Actinomyces sp. TaxID=249061 RepID=UPI0028EFACA3|nr:LacI family DNA-binding transcriptional regulator [uncultured Actinomyces sp.]
MKSSRPNMRDVAQLAGVSQRTVSNVVNNFPHISPATRKAVEDAIRQLGYRPNIAAQRLRQGQTHTLALAIPNLAWPYFGEIAHLIQEEARRSGYSIMVVETAGTREHEVSVLRDFRTNLIDGLILSPIELDLEGLNQLELDAPLVLLGERIQDAGIPHFSMDNVSAASEMVHHLYQQGARSFLILGSTHTRATSSAGALRQRGIEKALAELGLDSWAWRSVEVSPWTAGGAQEALSQWLESNNLPDAIFTMNDLLGIGALRALAEANVRVPEDVLVSTWDDTVLSRFSTPTLTTITPDTHAIAREAVQGLIALIEGRGGAGGKQAPTSPEEQSNEESNASSADLPHAVADVTVSHTLTIRRSTLRA